MIGKILATTLITMFACQANGETRGAAFVKAFQGLNDATIWNVLYIPNHPTSQIVVLYYDHGPSESIKVFAVASNHSQVIWSLSQIPLFMGVIDPNELHVITTSAGPAITLHGCAAHLCGDHGLAGAFVYLIKKKQFYTVYASWSDADHKTRFVYSQHGVRGEPAFVKRCLNKMLREEGYSPKKQ